MTTATATRLQLTLSCGERRYIPRWFSLCCSYNSRSPAESDVNKLLLPANDLATTHALLRRATPYGGISVPRLSTTTHALLRRATFKYCWFTLIQMATTHALLRRATPLAVEPLDDALATTHALLRRATATLCTLIDPQAGYNSRSPAESDVGLAVYHAAHL